ncbi:MAG: amidohydrolase [Lachnotalea sp.]
MARIIVLKNATILHADATVMKHKNIFIENGIISKIEDSNQEIQREQCSDTLLNSKENLGNPCEHNCEQEVIDCTHFVITPGIVNMHTHAAMSLFKGIAEDVSSDRWFNEIIWPYESKVDEHDVYIGTKLAIAEMIDCGVTTFSDHYFFEDAVYKAVEEAGIRAVIAPTLFGSAANFEERIDNTVSFIKEKKGKSDRIELRMGPHAPYTCPTPTLQRIIEEAKRLGVGIHLHVSENVPQVEKCIRENKKTPFGMIDEAGGFDIPCLVAHGSYIREEDLKYLKEDTWFATCPKTYMKLSSGTGNLYQLRSQLQYSFGTDGAASSNSLNPLEQARLFALIGKYQFDNCEDYTNKEIWQALMRGHKAFGFHSGQIQEGWNADLVIWDLKRANTYPVYNPVTSILYSADSTNVHDTMVGGTFLKRNGELVLDLTQLYKEANELKKEMLKRGKGKANVVY